MDSEQQRYKIKKEQKLSTVSFPDKPSSVPLTKLGNNRPTQEKIQNRSNIVQDQSDDITKDIQKVLYQNQRWSQPMNAPLKLRKKPNHSQIHDQGDNFIVINSDNKKSVDAFLEAQDLQKLRQKARQLSRYNQKLKQQNLQLRLQKMKLASNSESMQLLELKIEIQELTKNISNLEKQKEQVLKVANINTQYFPNDKNSLSKLLQEPEIQLPETSIKKLPSEKDIVKDSPYVSFNQTMRK